MSNASNATQWDGGWDKRTAYGVAIPVLLCLCCLATLGNGYVLVSCRWLRRRPSASLYLTISLCGADAWMSLVIGAALFLQSYLPVVVGVSIPYPYCIGLALEAFRLGAMVTSVLHLLALALNHYASILSPLKYPSLVTPELARWLIALLWATPPLLFLLFFVAVPGQAFRSAQCENVDFSRYFSFRLVVVAPILLPLLGLLLIYSHIFLIVVGRKSTHQLLTSTQDRGSLKRTLRTLKTTGLIIGTFVLGWVPSAILYVTACHVGCAVHIAVLIRRPQLLLGLSLAGNALIVAKAMADAIIYAARVREMKASLARMHLGLCGCGDASALDRDETLRLSSVRSHSRLHSIKTSPLARALTLTSKSSSSSPSRRRLAAARLAAQRNGQPVAQRKLSVPAHRRAPASPLWRRAEELVPMSAV